MVVPKPKQCRNISREDGGMDTEDCCPLVLFFFFFLCLVLVFVSTLGTAIFGSVVIHSGHRQLTGVFMHVRRWGGSSCEGKTKTKMRLIS